MQTTRYLLSTILLVSLMIPFSCGEYVWRGNENGHEETTDLLCEPNSQNDATGQLLGCDCTSLSNNVQQSSLKAVCRNLQINCESANLVPPKINVSSFVVQMDFSYNCISTVTPDFFGRCESVEHLDLSSNELSKFTGLNCHRLVSLDLSWNHISNLSEASFRNLKRLITLDLSHNRLVFVESFAVFEQLSILRDLNLEGNPLGTELSFDDDYEFSFQNLENLESLSLKNCSLPDFPIALIVGAKSLKKLNLADNLIQYLASDLFKEVDHLEELDLSGNLFKQIPAHMFMGAINLVKLKLDGMPSLTTIEAHGLCGMENLFEISMSYNIHLNRIDPLAFKDAPEMLNPKNSTPKVIYLNHNGLESLDLHLLEWKNLELLSLFSNPWHCDCNLQWIAEFHEHKPADAAIFTDPDFQCYTPPALRGAPVASVPSSEMGCESRVAFIAGAIALTVIILLLLCFVTLFIAKHYDCLPDFFHRYDIFNRDESLPKYTRVTPKPGSGRNNNEDPTNPGDLEWDSGDIGSS